MIFAEEISVGGWVGAAIGVLGAVGSLVVLVLNTRHRNQQEADQNALTPLREALDRRDKDLERQQKEIERREAHERDLMNAFNQQYEEAVQAQVDISSLYGSYVLVYDYMRRMAEACKRRGDDPGELPPMVTRPTRPDRVAMEFRVKTLRQQSQSISESKIVPKAHDPNSTTG